MLYSPFKRVIDFIASLGMLCLLWPLMVVVAGAIMADSPGSPLFRQKRVGRNGKVFTMLKFRSMVNDAASKGTYWTQENDPRITRTGRFLRKTSLDELPQLLNVLAGDMSLIGPRPELPEQQASYEPEVWELRHRVRPGITGLAQVNGRSAISREDQIRFDLLYAYRPTLALDIGIVFKTITQVLHRQGVN